jgi:hypothetical protein
MSWTLIFKYFALRLAQAPGLEKSVLATVAGLTPE